MEDQVYLMAKKRQLPVVRRQYTGMDQLALRASGQVMDANEDLAQQYRQTGRRLVDPRALRAAHEAGARAVAVTRHAGLRIGQRAPYGPPSVRGWRQSQMGTYGRLTGMDRQPWNARQQAGYMDMGARGPGFAEELDRAEKNRWQSGRLEQGSMTLHPTPERPYLMIRCPETSGNGTSSVHLRLTAQAPGGAESSREFFVGGGYTANFLLDGYPSVRVQILQTQNATDRIEWAWEIAGVQAGDQSLYLPVNYTNYTGVDQPVPEGAFEIAIADLSVQRITWKNPLQGAASEMNFNAPLLTSFVFHQVLGSQVEFVGAGVPAPADIPVVWRLRPI